MDFFNFYHATYRAAQEAKFYNISTDDTMFDFAKNLMDVPYSTYGSEAMTKGEAREIFAFVREKNYPLFKDLYECSARSLGGKL